MSTSHEAPMSLEMRRLRIALRLCFDPSLADVLATFRRDDTDDPVRALRPVVRAARLSYGPRRLLSLVRRCNSTVPLRPCLGLDTDAALLLALHVALDYDSAQLARLFGHSIETVGVRLQRARQAIAPERYEPCVSFRSLLGRYRELGRERETQIALLQHVAQCDDCRQTFERALRTDADLGDTAEAIGKALPPPAVPPRCSMRLLAHPALLVAGVAMIVALLVWGAAISANRVLQPSRQPIALTAVRPATQPAGWLLQADETGKVDGVDLVSGARRLLIPGVSGTRVDDLISPDHRTLAQTIYLQYPKQPESLRIYDLDGRLRQRWDLETAQYVRTPLTWMDNARLLMTQIPVAAFEPTLNVFTHNVRQGSSLVVLNVDTGAEQSIATEGVHLARSSPDGTFLALERYGDDSTGNLEVHAYDGHTLGPAIATFEDQPAAFWWSPDSRQLYAVVRDANGQFAIDAIDRVGQGRTLVQLGESESINLLGIAPDGQTLVYARGSDRSGDRPWAYWQMDTASGRARKLVDGEPGQLRVAQAAWSPAGNTLALTITENDYLAAGTPMPQPISYVTLAFDRQGNALGAMLDGLRANTLLGWLPEGGVPASLPLQRSTDGQGSGSTVATRANLTIDAFSRISPDGSRVLLHDQSRQSYVALPLNGDAPQQLGTMKDPSWLPDGAGIIGASAGSGPSRLTLTGSLTGMLRIDPAALGATTAVYQRPLIAPSGLRFSVFVDRGNTVQLWVGGRGQAAQPVASWVIPGDAKVDPPPVASWVGNDDLIFLTPDDWHAGLPRRTMLQRWSANSASIDVLLSWSTRGNERGILGQELERSRDSRQVAIRLRHFTGNDVEKDRIDSIVVATARDVSQAFEITRDAPGDGLSWSPDGTELAAGLRGEVAVLAADGRTIEYPPIGDGPSTEPLWLQPDEIWFAATDSSSPAIRLLRR